MSLSALLYLLSSLASCYPLADLMTSFPVLPTQGYPSLPSFSQFAGYLPIPNSSKQLYYVFVESQNDPLTDPLVLWLNGGPGCSSLDGFFYEHGPFMFYNGDSLQPNPYSWNLNASVIYLESPAGVGFSLIGDDINNSTDDEISAHDNLEAVLEWFEKFPEYASHEFYLAGESYGGVYVPLLAYSILQYNEQVEVEAVNLKGFAVGNALTDRRFDMTPATFLVAWSHNLLPWDFHDYYQSVCSDPESPLCNDAQNTLFNVYLNNTNMYNLYDNCTNTVGYTGLEYTPWIHPAARQPFRVNVPCVDCQAANVYLNTPLVQSAFHVSPDAALPWLVCTLMNYTSSPAASIWTYPTLIASGLRIFVYSGDVDLSNPFPGTRQWIAELNMEMIQDHTSFYTSDGQVAGYYEVYSGLTFVSVKGAGHMVPQYKPQAALQMFRAFVLGIDL